MAQRRERHVVDLRIRAPDAAARDGDLELARQVVEIGAAVEHVRGGLREGRGVRDLVGVHSRHRAAGHVARDVAAGTERRDADVRERPDDGGQVLDPDPVELDVLADRDVRHPARVALRDVGDRRELPRGQEPIGDPDAKHEVGHGLAFAALAADGTHAVTLRVDAPPAKIRVQPFGGNRIPALAPEPLDLGLGGPRVDCRLEALGPLCLRFLSCLRHLRSP